MVGTEYSSIVWYMNDSVFFINKIASHTAAINSCDRLRSVSAGIHTYLIIIINIQLIIFTHPFHLFYFLPSSSFTSSLPAKNWRTGIWKIRQRVFVVSDFDILIARSELVVLGADGPRLSWKGRTANGWRRSAWLVLYHQRSVSFEVRSRGWPFSPLLFAVLVVVVVLLCFSEPNIIIIIRLFRRLLLRRGRWHCGVVQNTYRGTGRWGGEWGRVWWHGHGHGASSFSAAHGLTLARRASCRRCRSRPRMDSPSQGATGRPYIWGCTKL